MSLRDDWDSQYTPDLFEELSEDVLYTPSGSNSPPVTVKAIFHRGYISLKVSGGMAVESSRPAFIVRDAQVANPLAGDVLTYPVINGISYRCVEVARTHSGVTVLLMDRAS